MKQKLMEIRHSKYGDLYGVVNGRVKYQNSENCVNLGRNYAKYTYRYNQYNGPIKLQLGGKDRIIDIDVTGDITPAITPSIFKTIYLPQLTSLVKANWDKGITIGFALWTVFRELGVLAAPNSRFLK